jgi:hypothetical protein
MSARPVLVGLCLAAVVAGCGDDGVAGGTGGAGGVEPPPSPYQDNLVQLTRMEGSNFVEILEVRARDDGWVFFCSGVRGLVAADATEPAEIAGAWRIASSLGSGQYPRCQHLAMAGEHLYMSNRGDEIQPTPFVTAVEFAGSSPVEGPSFSDPNLSIEGLAASGDLVFAAVHEDGVVILDNQGDALTPIGMLTGLTNAWALAVAGDLLYVADGPGGLVVADVSDPSAPTILGSVPIEGSAQFVELDGDGLAYVAAGSAGLVVVDVSTATAPEVLARVDTPGTSLSVSVADGHAFVADWNDLRVFDVADPSNPQLVAVERIPVFPGFPRVLGAAAVGDALFMGEWTGMYSYRFTPGLTAPDLRIASDRIDLGPAAVGDERAAAIILENEGNEPLFIETVTVKGEGASVQTALPITLEPGGKTAVEVRVVNPTTEPHFVSARVFSDDPDEPGPSVRIVTNNPGLGVGDPAPNVQVNLIEGGLWSLDAQMGNVVLLSYFATF